MSRRLRENTLAKNRSQRTPFPGTEPVDTSPTELPSEPLPPEPMAGSAPKKGLLAPIMLAPIGRADLDLIEPLRIHLEEMYRRPTEVHVPLPVPKYAFNPTRGQYHSAAILKRIESLYDSKWDSVIGFVDVDLFVPEVPFIFGEADRSTRSSIISFVRLRAETGTEEARKEILAKRLISEGIHQGGLIRGLAHCPNNRCVMFFATSVQEIDKRGSATCANCRKRLLDLY